MLVYLIKYDIVYGKFDGIVEVFEDYLLVDGKMICFLNNCDLKELFWIDLGVEVVIEVIGKFNLKEKVIFYVEVGVKKVILIVFGKNEDVIIVVGVNED